ncbi:MAG: nucleotidyltransferase family protein [Rectinema sp.]|nr:nucleotidyltransferase family protein [Rectinema sp.]
MKSAAILLAAGYSSRMGCCKPLIEVNGQSLLAMIAATFRAAGIEAIFAVTGWQREAIEQRARSAGIMPIYNPRFPDGMLSSICAGLQSIPPQFDGAFIHPVDIPFIEVHTIIALERAAAGHPILIPRYNGQPGHPVWIARSFFKAICSWNGEDGLRGFLRTCTPHPFYVDVSDEYILYDIDTPADLDFILASHRARKL